MAVTGRITNFRDEIVAAGMGLIAEGWSFRTAERRLQEQFPDEHVPDYSTLCDWSHHVDFADTLEGQRVRIAARNARIFEEKLEAVERGEEEISFQQAAVGYGISTDKVLKSLELKRPPDRLLPEILRAIALRAEEIREDRVRQERAILIAPRDYEVQDASDED